MWGTKRREGGFHLSFKVILVCECVFVFSGLLLFSLKLTDLNKKQEMYTLTLYVYIWG